MAATSSMRITSRVRYSIGHALEKDWHTIGNTIGIRLGIDWNANGRKNSLYVKGVKWTGQGLYGGYNLYPKVIEKPYGARFYPLISYGANDRL